MAAIPGGLGKRSKVLGRSPAARQHRAEPERGVLPRSDSGTGRSGVASGVADGGDLPPT